MRKVGIKYAASHPQRDEVRAAFVRVRSLAEWEAVLDRWYTDDIPSCYPSFETQASEGIDAQ